MVIVKGKLIAPRWKTLNHLRETKQMEVQMFGASISLGEKVWREVGNKIWNKLANEIAQEK